MMALSANEAYRELLRDIELGEKCSPRGRRTIERLSHQTKLWMLNPVVTIPERKLNYRFMLSEASWILSGSNQLNFNPTINKIWAPYSDDGLTLSGAYGPPVSSQLRYVIDCLRDDPSSRQAVLTIWRQNPRASKDIPCTIALQFLIRGSHIHCVATMRSSDAWLGWPYDIFAFTMITAFIGIAWNDTVLPEFKTELGTLTLTAGSQHIYEENWHLANKVCHSENIGDNLTISIYDFNTPDQLRNDLCCAIDGPMTSIHSQFFKDLYARTHPNK